MEKVAKDYVRSPGCMFVITLLRSNVYLKPRVVDVAAIDWCLAHLRLGLYSAVVTLRSVFRSR